MSSGGEWCSPALVLFIRLCRPLPCLSVASRQVRRAQAAIAKGLEAKDAAEKERLQQLSKDLKGRDYTYDHKGEVSQGGVYSSDHE